MSSFTVFQNSGGLAPYCTDELGPQVDRLERVKNGGRRKTTASLAKERAARVSDGWWECES